MFPYMRRSDNVTLEQINKAWTYYQHADNLQHQRHNIFILAQSIFFAAFTQAPPNLRYVVIVFGALYSILWWYLAVRLKNGMNALNNYYLLKDDVYPNYLADLKRYRMRLSGGTILNWILPLATLVMWLLLS